MSQPTNLYVKILQVMSEVKTIIKDDLIKISDTRSYTAVSRDAVVHELHDAVVKAKIVPKVSQKSCVFSEFETEKTYNNNVTKSKTYRAEVVVNLTLINAENPLEREEYEASAYAFDSGDKATGKAFSLAEKSLYLKAFMLESMDAEEARPVEPGTSIAKVPSTSQQQVVNQQRLNHTPQGSGQLSEAQVKRLYAIAHSKNMSALVVGNILVNTYKTEHASTLSKQDYDELCNAIQSGQSSEQIIKAKAGK